MIFFLIGNLKCLLEGNLYIFKTNSSSTVKWWIVKAPEYFWWGFFVNFLFVWFWYCCFGVGFFFIFLLLLFFYLNIPDLIFQRINWIPYYGSAERNIYIVYILTTVMPVSWQRETSFKKQDSVPSPFLPKFWSDMFILPSRSELHFI